MAQKLGRAGLNVFRDTSVLEGGVPWRPAIEAALAESDALVLFVSQASLDRFQKKWSPVFRPKAV